MNTLGVLYVLENETETVQSVADLKEKTIYTTGEGATPQYILEYLLKENGLKAGEDVTVVYRATADEVQADIQQAGAIAMLPEPKATVVTKAITTVRYALDITAEWDDEDGKHHSEPLHGWPARIFQHETDHLSGELYIDRAEIRSLTTTENLEDYWCDDPVPTEAAEELGFAL